VLDLSVNGWRSGSPDAARIIGACRAGPRGLSLILFLRSMQALAKILFLLALGLSLTGTISPPVALLSGILLGLLFTNPYAQPSRTAARVLLQVSVVALGFGMNLHEVLKAGRSGFIYTALGITFAFLVGSALGKILQVRGNSSLSDYHRHRDLRRQRHRRIGRLFKPMKRRWRSPSARFYFELRRASDFPRSESRSIFRKHSLGSGPRSPFTTTSSVVGAATKYGPPALVVGTTVKLARALWIVPLALVTAAIKRHGARIQFPWFILFFVFAALANTYLPAQHSATKTFFTLGRFGLTATLFLIGTEFRARR